MKNKIYMVLVLLIIVFMAIFLMAAFVNWEINPSKWSESARLATIVFFLCCIGPSIMIVDLNADK